MKMISTKEFWDENSTHFNILDVMIIIFIVVFVSSSIYFYATY